MSVSNQKVVGQLNSIRTSLIKTIIALRGLEDKARTAGNTEEADALLLRRLELNDQSITLWQAEAAAGTTGSLAPQIAALEEIASDARKVSKRIKTAGKVLDAAVKILIVLEKLAILLG